MPTILKVHRVTRHYVRNHNGDIGPSVLESPPTADVPESEALAWLRGTGLTSLINFTWPDGHSETYWGGSFLRPGSRLAALAEQEDKA